MMHALMVFFDLAITVYILIVLARVVSSWLALAPGSRVDSALGRATEPVLARLRRIVPLQFGGVDFSPAVLLVALSFLQRVIRHILH